MKERILLTVSLAVIIALTMTGMAASSSKIAFAIEDYLQLRSATVTENGNIDVDIQTGGNIPTQRDDTGFGYAVLTDVGDEFVDNVLVAVTHIGFDDFDRSIEDNEFHTHVLDLTNDISSDCSGSDFEVSRTSTDNEAFDPNFPLSIQNNKISIDNIDTNDLAGDTVKAISSFTAEAIFDNDGDVQHVCVDIQDVLKQSEISIRSHDNGNGDNDDGKDDEHNDDGRDDDKNRHKDNEKDRKHEEGRDNDKNDDKKHEDKKDKEDKGSKDREDDGSSSIDIDQDIDQSNTCSGSATCSNEGSSDADVDTDSSSSSGNSDLFDIEIDQAIDQSNTCSDEADCSNEGRNDANLWEKSDSEIYGDVDIGQSIEQSNECDDEASCSNEASDEANALGYSSASDYEEETDFGSNIDIGQSIEQSNTCGGEALCSNEASNVANIG
jgi:hypothetical protein